MSVALVRAQREALGPHRLLEIQDDPQVRSPAHPAAQADQKAVVQIDLGQVALMRASSRSMTRRSGSSKGKIRWSIAEEVSKTNRVFAGSVQTRVPWTAPARRRRLVAPRQASSIKTRSGEISLFTSTAFG
jgi:hypothetical protein